MQMKDIAALAGESVAVEFPRDEADKRFGGGKAIVEAVVLVAPHEFEYARWSGRSETRKGARLRLVEPLRVVSRHESATHGFEELPAGHEFNAESRLIEGAWDAFRGGRRPNDAEAAQERRERYEAQDALRAAVTRLGLPPAEMRSGEVTFALAPLVKALGRLDPEDIATDAIAAFVEEVCRRQPWTGLGDMQKTYPDELRSAKVAALREITDGFAVSDAELAEA